MSEEAVAISQEDVLKKNVSDVVGKLESKNFSIYFYSPSLNHPSGGMGVLFKQARILKDEGYNVKIIFEPKADERASYNESVKAQKKIHIYEKFNPSWLDFNISDLEFLPQVGVDEKNQQVELIKYNDGSEQKIKKLQISPEDFIILPEGHTNIMAQMAQSPAKRIILVQSWIYILNSLQPGQTWKTFGINDCISISDGITEYLNTTMPGLKIKQYSQGINRDIFNVPKNISDKVPMIAFSCSRGPESRMKTYNIIRNFQQWYPQYKWFRFSELTGLSREEYAERLKSCAMILYTDDIAGFGTAPLEAMACGTHVVGWAPYGGKEYINTQNGFWANNGDVFGLSEYLGIAINKYLDGELDNSDVQKSYDKTLERYTAKKEKESVIKIYKEYINERIDEIKQLQAK